MSIKRLSVIPLVTLLVLVASSCAQQAEAVEGVSSVWVEEIRMIRADSHTGELERRVLEDYHVLMRNCMK
jgi:hypothetical protein